MTKWINKYVFTFEDYDFGKLRIRYNPKKDTGSKPFLCEWMDHDLFYVVLTPDFFTVSDWPSLLDEFEDDLHSSFKAYFSPILQKYLDQHNIEELILHRKSSSIRHKFGLPASSLDPELSVYDATFSQRKFWNKYKAGILPDELVKEILKKSLYPPKRGEKPANHSIYTREMPTMTRSVWVNWKETFSNFDSPKEFVQFLVESNRYCVPQYKKATELKYVDIMSTLSDKFVTRSGEFKSFQAGGKSPKIFSENFVYHFCSFLFKKELVIIPTKHNRESLLNGSLGFLVQNIAIKTPPHVKPLKLEGLPLFKEKQITNKSFSGFFTEYPSSEITPAIPTENNSKNIALRSFSDLSFSEKLLSISKPNKKKGLSVYALYNPSKHSDSILFNPSEHLVLLEEFNEISDWGPILFEYQNWVSTLAQDNSRINEVAIDSIPKDQDGFRKYLQKQLNEVCSLPAYIKTRRKLALHQGELLSIFLWSRHLLLLPSINKHIARTFPIYKLIEGFEDFFGQYRLKLNSKKFKIPNISDKTKPIRRFPEFIRGFAE